MNKIRSLSVVTSDRNEIWFLLPNTETNYSNIMIFDYIRNEWIRRRCQHINCFTIYNSKLYSAGTNIYQEYKGDDFDGEYIQHYFNCTPMNLGEDNKLKILVFPPRVTVAAEYTNFFWVKYIKNYDYIKKTKEKQIKTKSVKGGTKWDEFLWAEDENPGTDSNWSAETQGNSIYKLRSATFKTLEIQFFTKDITGTQETKPETFSIKSMELSKIKVKQV